MPFLKKKIDEDYLITEKTEVNYSLEEWKQTWMNRLGDNVLFISALNQENIEEFKKKIYEAVREIHVTRFPYNSCLYQEHDSYVEGENDEAE